MKKWFSEHKKAIILSVLGTLVPMAIGCILWNQLPASMSIHWGVDGAADGFGSRGIAVFLLPGILAVLDLLCLLITTCDPGQKAQNKKVLGIIFWIMPVISMVSCGVVYAVAMGRKVNVMLLMPLLIGVIFLIIGNYMPKMKQNFTMGIKLPWTCGNEENWNKTHRFAGKLTAGTGVVVLLAALLPAAWMLAAVLAAVLVICVLPTVYSYRIYKAHKAQGIAYTALPNAKNQKRYFWISVIMVTLILAGVTVLMFTGGITYTWEEDALRIEATYDSGLVLPYEAVDSIELREDFDIGFRVMGFSSAKLSLGAFQNEELGNYTAYAYNGCDSMILIRSGEKWLALNGETPEETQMLYRTLLDKTTE